jgi:hypothetical protein
MPAARLRPHLPFQLESHALDRDLALLVVDLDEALGHFVGCVGVFLEVDFNGSLSLVDAATGCYLLCVLHALTRGHLEGWSSHNNSPLCFHALLALVAPNVGFYFVLYLQFGL